jgi:hypothetical protein
VRLGDLDPDPDAVFLGFFYPADASLFGGCLSDSVMIGRLSYHLWPLFSQSHEQDSVDDERREVRVLFCMQLMQLFCFCFLLFSKEENVHDLTMPTTNVPSHVQAMRGSGQAQDVAFLIKHSP